MRTLRLGLPLTDLIRLRQELRRLSAAATAAGIGQWIDDAMPRRGR